MSCPCLTHENLSYVHLLPPLPPLFSFLGLDEEKHKDLASHVSEIVGPLKFWGLQKQLASL